MLSSPKILGCTGENGRDMIWNPTSNIVTEEFPFYSKLWRIFRRKLFVRWKTFCVCNRRRCFSFAEDDYLSGDLCPSYDEGFGFIIYYQILLLILLKGIYKSFSTYYYG